MAQPNQYTKRVSAPDPNFGHVLVGPSNEELLARDLAAKAEREASGYPRVEMGRDAEDKQIFDRLDDDEFDPLSESDPLRAAVKAYGRPGFANKLLSDRVCNIQGTRGYQPVMDGKGNIVKIGNMMLGEIPQALADKRQRRNVQMAEESLQTVQETFADQVEAAKRQARSVGLRVLEPGERVISHETGEGVDIGSQFSRGSEPIVRG